VPIIPPSSAFLPLGHFLLLHGVAVTQGDQPIADQRVLDLLGIGE